MIDALLRIASCDLFTENLEYVKYDFDRIETAPIGSCGDSVVGGVVCNWS